DTVVSDQVYLIWHPVVSIKRRIQEQSNLDQTTGTPNMEKIVIMNAMKNNYFVKEYFDM
ncbi:hypothetical protein NC652_023799, partial [Populus alba x Populus x berolinensis]